MNDTISTSRTDEAAFLIGDAYPLFADADAAEVVTADFARRLEREAAQSKAYAQQVVTTATSEVNTLKAENARLIAERDKALIEVAAIRTLIHDLCHDKHTKGPVTPAEFTDGCEAFQQTLFGCSPIKDLRKANERLMTIRSAADELHNALVGQGSAGAVNWSRVSDADSELLAALNAS